MKVLSKMTMTKRRWILPIIMFVLALSHQELIEGRQTTTKSNLYSSGGQSKPSASPIHTAPSHAPTKSIRNERGPAPVYAACFLTWPTHVSLLAMFANVSQPCPAHQSNAVLKGTSLEVVPPALRADVYPAAQGPGQEQIIQVLAYARDEYVQTVLVAEYLPSTATGGYTLQISKSSYPSIVLSLTNDTSLPHYNRISGDRYVDGLWSRLEGFGLIQLTRDSTSDRPGRITSVSLNSGTSLTQLLPATLLFPQTTVQVQIMDPLNPANYFPATLCRKSAWNLLNETCEPQPTPSPFLPNYPIDPIKAFFNQTTTQTLLQQYVTDPCTYGWDVVAISDHSTIEFAPPDPHVYDPYLGQEQEYGMVAYARDEHASSVLLTLTSPTNNPVYSKNYYSHTTVTAMGLGGSYGAVYSNVLWTRLVAAGILNVTRDVNGHIISAAFMSNSSGAGLTELVTSLPEYVDTQYEFTTFEPTQVYVRIMDPSTQMPLIGHVCVSDKWNSITRQCIVPPTNSSSSSSSSTGGDSPASNPPSSGLSYGVRVGLIAGGSSLGFLCLLFICLRCRRSSSGSSGLDAHLLIHDDVSEEPYARSGGSSAQNSFSHHSHGGRDSPMTVVRSSSATPARHISLQDATSLPRSGSRLENPTQQTQPPSSPYSSSVVKDPQFIL